MKKSILQKFILMNCFIAVFSLNSQAQISDSVSIMPGYTNRSFYQMNSGNVSTTLNTNWDLGFQLRGRSGSIIINSKINVRLWKANKAIADWASITATDTTGILIPSNELHNSETTWNLGAFNTTNNPGNLYDLGWGVYDPFSITHGTFGDSIYFISLANNTVFKKLKIEELNGYTYDYTFRYADLDGSNEVVYNLMKSDFPNKHFGYYSMVNGVIIDREPAYNAWDLSFEQYNSQVAPAFYYNVSGVLMNDSVSVAKAYPVDTATATASGRTFTPAINTIGYDWKVLNGSMTGYDIADSLIYYVRDRQGVVWSMIFTGFGGGANGNFYFTKQQVALTGLNEASSIQTFGLFPNPAKDFTRLMISAKNQGLASLSIIDISGRQATQRNIELINGVQAIDLDLQHLTPGLYQIIIRQGNDQQISRIVVQ